MNWVYPEPIWLCRPDFADVLVGRQASEGLKSLGEVIGHQEGVDVRFELAMRAVMVALHGRLFEGSVHPFNLAVGPRMTWLCQSVLDAVSITEHVEHMGAPARRRSETVLRQISELDAVVGEHGVDLYGTALIRALRKSVAIRRLAFSCSSA